MRKTFKLFLSFLMILTIINVIYAEDVSDRKDTDLSYRINEEYLWSVPSSITFTEDNYQNINADDNDSKIKIFENNISEEKQLQVRIDNTNTLELKNSLNDTLKYEIYIDGVNKKSGDIVLCSTYGIKEAEAELKATLIKNNNQIASDYHDTLLFVAEVVDIKKEEIEMPEMGELITLDDKEYRVLDVDGTKAKLLSMYNAAEIQYDANTTSFNGEEGIQYAGSDLDNYLENEFYSSLSFKDAIVSQDIEQSMYSFNGTPAHGSSWYKSFLTPTDTSGTDYTVSKFSSVSVGKRNVYVLDVDDIIEYLGSYWTPQQLNTMFFNSEYSIANTKCWLRSADKAYADRSWGVNANLGCIDTAGNYVEYIVRPVFVLDFNKIQK